MRKLRVLIVDESVVIRRSLALAFSREPDFEMVGSAPSGRVALMKIPILRPDLIALDVEMPETDGVGTLAAIRKAYPQILVIILSVPTERGATATLDALALGALDYVTKPETGARGDDKLQILAHELISKIRACSSRVSKDDSPQPSDGIWITRTVPTAASGSAKRTDVVAIGVSTGGPNALMEVLPEFPANFPVPILIVQHMPPMFTRLLAERLAVHCKIRVSEGRSGQQLCPGAAWIAPGDFHMTVEREGNAVNIVTRRNEPENSCRPAVDVLFRSVAQVYRSHVLAVVMTGMGQDGLRGCQQIHASGGQVIVQDEASAIVWGMPSFVVKAGIADRIVPLPELASEILNRVRRYRSETALIHG